MAHDHVSSAPYAGDAALAPLLRDAKSRYTPETLRALIAGVLSAPEPVDPDAWMILVAPKPNAALAAQLRAPKAELAATHDDGLGQGAWTKQRLVDFRAELARRGLDGFVLPRGDEHQGEYVSPRNERLAWMTGFTGSAGATIIL